MSESHLYSRRHREIKWFGEGCTVNKSGAGCESRLFGNCTLDSCGLSGRTQTQTRSDGKVCNQTNMLSFGAEGWEPRAPYSGPSALIKPHHPKTVQQHGFCAPGIFQPASSPQGLCMCCSPCSTHIPSSFSHSCHLLILFPISMSPPPGRPPGLYKGGPNTPTSCPFYFSL